MGRPVSPSWQRKSPPQRHMHPLLLWLKGSLNRCRAVFACLGGAVHNRKAPSDMPPADAACRRT